MRVSVFGLGYVGCVTAACLARDGHVTLGMDINPQKMERLAAGHATIAEPGLEELVAENVRRGTLRTATDTRQAVLESDVSLICVGTPSNGNGKLNLRYAESVCQEIGTVLAEKQDYHVVVVRSTVVPGTVTDCLVPILEAASGRHAGEDFGVCMNPEFLREGSAIEDYNHPSFIVIGEWDQASGDVAQELYQNGHQEAIVRTNIATAEMLKYVNNAWHALKVAFANEVGNLCKAHGIDGQELMSVFVRDRQLNLSPLYLRPGYAFGGSCLPKDLRAITYRAKELDLEVPLLNSILTSNQGQIQRAIQMVESKGRNKVGVLGLSFKAGTDDVRESPVVPLIETLVGKGYQVSIYDERVDPGQLFGANKAFLERQLPHIAANMRTSIKEVVDQAEVIVIANGSAAFRKVPDMLRSDQVLIDLVGIGKAHEDIKGGYDGIAW
jgi:GDP-mannose 6-dehydrogenase